MELSLPLLGCLQVEMVRPMQQNVAGQDWGVMFEIAILHSIPLRTQVVKRCLHVAGIPHGYHVEERAQTGRDLQFVHQPALP